MLSPGKVVVSPTQPSLTKAAQELGSLNDIDRVLFVHERKHTMLVYDGMYQGHNSLKSWTLPKILSHYQMRHSPKLFEQLNYTGRDYTPPKYPDITIPPTKGRVIFDIEGILPFTPDAADLIKLQKVVARTVTG